MMIHSGSRGLGYQVCDDALRALRNVPREVRHRAARPAAGLRAGRQPRGASSISAPCGPAANFAWCNRQLLMWQAREVFATVFGRTWEELRHEPGLRRGPQHRQVRGARDRRRQEARLGASQGRDRRLSAAPSRSAGRVRAIGQPVIIPGDMGRASWVLVGQPGSMEQTFGTACHGAGRVMSRTAAIRNAQGRRIDQELLEHDGHRAMYVKVHRNDSE